MWTSDQEHNSDGKTATALAAFTAVELERLELLRERYAVRLGYAELGIDLRRLEFARWLVQRGLLSEDL